MRDREALIAARPIRQRVAAELAALDGPQPRPVSAPASRRATRAAYLLPVEGLVEQGFGEVSDAGVRARGPTFAVLPGAPVRAPASGRVAFAGPFRSLGNILVVDHGGGWSSALIGLRELRATRGATVRRGALLGFASAHVTVELRRRGKPFDLLALAAR